MTATIQEFEKSADAFDLAKRMAKYGHRDWIVWQTEGGAWKSAKLSRDSLEAAMAEAVGSEAKPGRFSCIGRDTAIGQTVSPALAAVWLSNMKAGHFWF